MLPTKPPGEKPAFLRRRVRRLLAPDTSGREFGPRKTSEGVFTSPWDLCIDNSLREDPYFAVGGDTPKVQVPYITVPGHAPRQLVEERLRRGYLVLDLLQLLAAKGIRSNNLMPGFPVNQDDSVPKSYKLVSPFLPLEIFDNDDYECRTPESWLTLGTNQGWPKRKPIPALALLLTESSYPEYKWHLVGVLDYSSEKCQYLVEEVLKEEKDEDEDEEEEEEEEEEDKKEEKEKEEEEDEMFFHHSPREDKEVGRKSKHKKNVTILYGGTKHWVPRIRLLFKAEDPRIFADRIESALRLRREGEIQLLYSTSVDCMPFWEANPSLCHASLQRIKELVKSACGFKGKLFESCIKNLENQAKLEYDRVMNRMVFDNTVMTYSEEFSDIILPQKDPERIPEKIRIPVPPLHYQVKQSEFAQNSLLNLPEVIAVIHDILETCHKVTDMRLFDVMIIKLQRVDEFERIQSQVQNGITLYLQEKWVISLSNSIHAASNSLSDEIIYRLMKQVVFRMRNSLRTLVLDSLKNLSEFLLDSCQCGKSFTQDLVWGKDLISSPYRSRKNPLFLVDLILDQNGVHYSTPLEDFESFVTKLFRSAILVTHKIPQLYRFVMKKLVVMGSLLIEPMCFYENEVVALEEKVRNVLKKATIPLRAYAARYEKHLDLHNLDIDAFKSLNAEMAPQEVKKQVEYHLKKMEKLEYSLPSYIVIGPFFVRVQAVRQALIKKRKFLANALLENLALMLSKEIENACEKCIFLSRTLQERPNSIEELTEKREWMKEIPDHVKSYKEQLSKILMDYEVLEDLNFHISNEDFGKKWTAVGWPLKINSQAERVYAQHEEDEKRFNKIQLSDQNKLEEQIDALQSVVAEFVGYDDLDLAHEIANKAKRAKAQFKQCLSLSDTYNTRERLLGLPISNFDHLTKLINDFKPFEKLWTTTSDWLRWTDGWFNDPLTSIDSEPLDRLVTGALQTMSGLIKQFEGNIEIQTMASVMLTRIEEFQPYSLLIQCLRSPGMKSYHWEMISENINITVRPKANMSLARYMELGIQDHLDEIVSVAQTAGQEYSIEQALETMEEEWATVEFDSLFDKEAEKSILKVPDEIFQRLDDHIVKTQNLSLSPVKKVFETRLNSWEKKLRLTQDVLEEWLECQRAWLTLEPIFSCDEVKHKLKQGNTYKHIEQRWRNVMRNVDREQNVIEMCQNVQLLSKLKRYNMFLGNAQKGLKKYLEEKRSSFPRYFFLSDVELLQILSRSKDPTAVQQQLHKCFENISQLQFESDLEITHMYSKEGEKVQLSLPVSADGNVDNWLRNLEKSMQTTLRDNIEWALQDYSEKPHVEWVFSYPGQVAIASFLVFWTAEVSTALEKRLLHKVLPPLQNQLSVLVQLMRGGVSKTQQAVLSSLIVIEVHAKDVVSKLVEQKVLNINDFEWISQLRYYWTNEELHIHAMNAEFLYGYEYLGNSSRMVITPLTNRCYLGLTGALHRKLGGGVTGATGSGKTETIKDLGNALAMHTVVFNCSDKLKSFAVERFLKGVASSGAWAILDDIARVHVEVLSVVAQQISTIQKAQQQQAENFVFDGVEVPLVPSCAIFFTMNFGHTSCNKIPANLKNLFRPVSMVIPEFDMIVEISLYSLGFSDASALSKKIDKFFKLLFDQLASQEHYYFDIRAVKAVIAVAGNLRRDNPAMNEGSICLQAIHEISIPQFSQSDLELVNAILKDLFHETQRMPMSYDVLEESLRDICKAKNLKDELGFINKCIQLYQTTVMRHGLMLVGPPAAGKTKCYEVLAAALTALEGKPSSRGGVYQAVQIHVLNPKSITMPLLYGNYKTHNQHWKDGILPAILREGAAAADKKKRWYVLDGPLEAGWMDGLNTVLDDNKKLCLSCGEVINLTDEMTIMFEVQDLAGASPTTASRCGMVYLEPNLLALSYFTECWLKHIPEALTQYAEHMNSLFSRFLPDSISFVRSSVKEIIPSLDSNLICSLLKLMDCFFSSHHFKEGEKPVLSSLKELAHIEELIEPWFFFSLVWSVGATGDGPSRQGFSDWLRNKMAAEQIKLSFPEEGLVYDYRLDVEDEDRKVQWANWMKHSKGAVITTHMSYEEIFIPTPDTERMSYLMDLLLTNMKPLLCVGPSGAGKTLTMTNKLMRSMPDEFITHAFRFSASTSASQTQDFFESKLSKRRKGAFGPKMGDHFIFFIDDLHMPMSELCRNQTPFELLRQWLCHGGWYDRDQIGTFNHLVDINLVCAMGTSRGDRDSFNQGFTRHFNILSLNGLEDSIKTIYSTILGSWMGHTLTAQGLQESLVDATIKVYTAVTNHLLPTPAKCHYTFSFRDMSKVFQGILLAEAYTIKDEFELLRLWYHESCRVFRDRLVCVSDREWFNNLLEEYIDEFHCPIEDVLPDPPVLFGDFMSPESDQEVYTVIEDKEELKKVMEQYVHGFNQSSPVKEPLGLFMDGIEHVCRINRILRQPLGHALLLGGHLSGRKTLARLASYVSGHKCLKAQVSKNYGRTEWRNDIKNNMLSAGLQNQKITHLFVESQIKKEFFLEDICNFLITGELPNLYSSEEHERILKTMKPVVEDLDQQLTEANLLAAYHRRVHSNFHLILCMSPAGKGFRALLRQYPSLVKCCTLDWFDTWPDEALQAVARASLDERLVLDISPETKEALTLMCVNIHQQIVKKSAQYQTELSRCYYITAKSFTEFLKLFTDLTEHKKQKLDSSRQRIDGCLDKLCRTVEDVKRLQEEEEQMRPLLEEAAKEVEVALQTIHDTSAVAVEIRKFVQEEQTKVLDKERFAKAISVNAQRDIDKALKTLDIALDSLKALNASSFIELQDSEQYTREIKLVLAAVCIVKGIEPAGGATETPDAPNFEEYVEPAENLLQEPMVFLESLFNYDKDTISDDAISLLRPYMDDEEFQPPALVKISVTCSSICQWVRAIYDYHFVLKAVEPKWQVLKEAEEDLRAAQQVVSDGQKKLEEVEESIPPLEAKYQECLAKQKKLDDEYEMTEAHLVRANKLVEGLAKDEEHWKETVIKLDNLVSNLAGDMLLCAGYVTYLGPFCDVYRAAIVEEWLSCFKELDLPHTEETNLISSLGDPITINFWKIAGLPSDTSSVENSIIAQYSVRWTLFIDPRGQANRWIKNRERDNGLRVLRLSHSKFVQGIKNAILDGKPCLVENVGEELDPAIEPVLFRQTFEEEGKTVLRLGDSVVPLSEDFKLYITTKLPNPHYSPEVFASVTVINFTGSPSAMEDQLLSRVVAEELPDMEDAKNKLIVSCVQMTQELKEIEDKIVLLLISAAGGCVDEDLNPQLEAYKNRAEEIKTKILEAKNTEQDIDAVRLKYSPVAVRARILFFCVSELSNIDPMYQYSFEWFLGIFMKAIASCDTAEEERIDQINGYFTFSLYVNVCQGLFEKHKLMFAFYLCARIMMNEDRIKTSEWKHLLSGGEPVPKLTSSEVDWMSDRAWQDILDLSTLDNFDELAESFKNHLEEFKIIFDSEQPHREPLPGKWGNDLNSFQTLLVLRCLRPDCVIYAVQDFVSAHLGEAFIETQMSDLSVAFKESSPTYPIVVILSPGTDPVADIYKFAGVMGFSEKVSGICLTQRQGSVPESMMRAAMKNGHWVIFQNCHLVPDWLPTLERLIACISPKKVHEDFRLWLTIIPFKKIPLSLFRNGSKIIAEPPRGIRENLERAYLRFTDEFLSSSTKESKFKPLLFSLCLFHAVAVERRRFGPLGFNTPYEFTDQDLDVCVDQLQMFLEQYQDIPYKLLEHTAGEVNYGGHVTDIWDRRCLLTLLKDFYSPAVLSDNHVYSGVYRQVDSSLDIEGYLAYIRDLPINDTAELFGLHDNASIRFAQNETFALLDALIGLQPQADAATSARDKTFYETVEEVVIATTRKLPQTFSLHTVTEKYPDLYDHAINTVLIHEVIRYNNLLEVICQSLSDMLKALEGTAVLSPDMELMALSLFNNRVPEIWTAKAYPSMKPLASWVSDLLQRINFFQEWISDGNPLVFWISGFFFPQAFLTGILQNYARHFNTPIEVLGFGVKVMVKPLSEIREMPNTGCYIHGLFLEGAGWNYNTGRLSDSNLMEFYTQMPVIWLIPKTFSTRATSWVYLCPVYKTPSRAENSSTTGLSSNYVTALELPTELSQRYWIKRGVALLCALDH
ncbi:dynein axonemal heavy chain 1 isoform X2 [Gambusia affinis]|uniref:dynein axonemal heavy chain 1 isoform X2 n=1 Tax=Gambusia affinis TaxID=33528 RepID=UPI001CDCB3ED|nr:dynein axonemal heavy chain 1 isoform X2 [Gambusia affinis]